MYLNFYCGYFSKTQTLRLSWGNMSLKRMWQEPTGLAEEVKIIHFKEQSEAAFQGDQIGMKLKSFK